LSLEGQIDRETDFVVIEPQVRMVPPIADAERVLVPRLLSTQSSVEVGWHTHEEGLLYAVFHGLASIQTETGTCTMMPGQVGWLPPSTRHGGHCFGKAEALFLYLRPDVCHMMPDTPRVLSMSPLSKAIIDRLGAQTPPLPPHRVEQLLAVLVEEIREAGAMELYLPMPREPRLVKIASALQSNPDDNTDLDGWARSLGMTRRTLMRRFQQETGLTIGQWRQQLRLLKAVQLLAEGHSVTSAALAVGYSSLSAFIASFRQRFGVTPAKYFDRSDAG
jgi:AraC-like DNA-binding protein